MSSEKLQLEATEHYKIVRNVSEIAWKLIQDSTSHVPATQQWLLVGRIVSYLFHRHFRLSIGAAQESQPHPPHKGGET